MAILAAILVGQSAIAGHVGSDASAASTTVRGIYRFSSTSWKAMAASGFNWATDGGVGTNNYSGQRAAGLSGMVWLDAYDNSSCLQTMTDARLTQIVKANAGAGNRGAIYQVGDEPTTKGCQAASTYAHMSSVIHAADPAARSWVADDQFNDPSISNWPAGLPMKGSVDILAFDIYPCQAGPCRYDMIDRAIQRIHAAGLKSWEFILQDFGPCQSWRAPTADELMQQFKHWRGAGAIGYWVYAYDRDPTPCPGDVAGSAVLAQINALTVNPGATVVSPKPRTTPSTAATVSPSPPRGSPKPSAKPSPSASSTPGPWFALSSGSATLLGLHPMVFVGAGLLLVLGAGGWGYLRRRRK